ncbi:hypothetical protein D3Z53_25295 [Lachnospiraceae bacterium]|nr:hypothetical protein [Lachnospiraceae bacterium]
MEDLTKEQKYLLLSMYKEVLNKQPALPMEKANYFEDSNVVQELILPDQSSEYVSDLCWNLKSKGYIFCSPGDNLANNIVLTDKTIIYMENRFKNGIKDIAMFLSNFLPF